jgi:PKD repeat protein
VATFTSSDSGATAGQFTAVINWGDGNYSVATVAWNGSGFNVSGTHTYAAAGSYTVSLQIADSNADSVISSGSITVADARDARPERGGVEDEDRLPERERERLRGRDAEATLVAAGDRERPLTDLTGAGEEQEEDGLVVLDASLDDGLGASGLDDLAGLGQGLPPRTEADRTEQQGASADTLSQRQVDGVGMSRMGVLVLDVCATVPEDQTASPEGGIEGAEVSPTDAVFAELARGEGVGAAERQDGPESDPTLLDCLLALPAALLDDLFVRL